MLVDEIKEERAIDRSYAHAPDIDGQVSMVKVPENISSGEFVNVKITSATDYDLTGVIPD